MTIKRYFAASARDALRKVKEDIGPDAIVVSNRSVRGGVEITAMSAASLDEISSRADASEQVGEQRLVAAGGARHVLGFASTSVDDYTVSLSAQARNRATASRLNDEPKQNQNRPRISAWQPPRYDTASGTVSSIAMPRDSVASAEGQGGPDLAREMQEIRSLLEKQLAGFAWGELLRASPARAQLMTELLETGFSGVLARRMTQDVTPQMTLDDGRKHVASILDRRLRVHDADSDLIHRGGVYALVGPTGVGKTTTTAKLAARCVLQYGADRVALITTDDYRIGAHEQLRIYGDILGVQVHAVSNRDALRNTLDDLADKHMVLIDTAGMSQRDHKVREQGSLLASSGKVKRLLLLNATSRGDTLDDVTRAYGGEDIAACIVSKIDESTTLAPVIDAVVRSGMPLAYLANGQRVPEDMHLPNRQYLLHRALKPASGNMAHRLKAEEVGMVLAASSLHDAVS